MKAKSSKSNKKKKKKAIATPKRSIGTGVWLAYATLLVLVVFAYSGAFNNDFVDWDDFHYVIDNESMQPGNWSLGSTFFEIISLNYHPLTMLTMYWQGNSCSECMFGISARPFIILNVIFHLANVFLTLILVYWLTGKKLIPATFVAAILAIHPMHVESVAWVSERKDVLYTFFVLLSMIAYYTHLSKNFTKSKWKRYSLPASFLFFILACLAKAMAVVLPFLLIIIQLWLNPRKNGWEALKVEIKWNKLKQLIPFFAISLFFGLIALNVQSGSDLFGLLDKATDTKAIAEFETFNLLQRFQFAAYGLVMYIFKLFIPTKLSPFYPYPTQTEYDQISIYWLALLLGAILIGLMLVLLKKYKKISLSILFYIVSLILVLQFISVGAAIMADRYTYLPYVGLALIPALFIEMQTGVLKKALMLIATAGLLIFTVLTSRQVEIWQDSETLWTHMITLYPDRVNGYELRAAYYGKQLNYLQQEGEKIDEILEKSEQDYLQAIELGTKKAIVYEGLGNLMGMRKEFGRSIEYFDQAILLAPNSSNLYINRGITYAMSGNQKRALEDMQKGAGLEPSVRNILYRGIAYQSVGDNLNAKSDFEKVLELDPNNLEAKTRLSQL